MTTYQRWRTRTATPEPSAPRVLRIDDKPQSSWRSAMQRSRVTVEYGHLPGQVFEHEVDGVYCVVRDISGGRPDIPLAQVLEALELRVNHWRDTARDAPRVSRGGLEPP